MYDFLKVPSLAYCDWRVWSAMAEQAERMFTQTALVTILVRRAGSRWQAQGRLTISQRLQGHKRAVWQTMWVVWLPERGQA